MRDVAQLSIRRTAVFVQQYQQKRQELLALLGRTDAIKAQVVENGVKQLDLGSMQSEHEADVILRRYVERMLGEKDEQRRAELTKLMNQELQALKLADKHRVKKNPNTTSQS